MVYIVTQYLRDVANYYRVDPTINTELPTGPIDQLCRESNGYFPILRRALNQRREQTILRSKKIRLLEELANLKRQAHTIFGIIQQQTPVPKLVGMITTD